MSTENGYQNGYQNGHVNGHHNGIVTTAADTATGLFSYAHQLVDRVVSPESRQRAYDRASDFAAKRPILFSFVVGQLLFSFIPLLLFASFSLSTVAFALGTSLVFSLFWIGVAFMVLVPTLLLTSSVAVLAWSWVVGSFVVARWLYNQSPFAQGDEVVKKEKGTNGI